MPPPGVPSNRRVVFLDMKQSFSKPALTWEQQVELLKQRGMLIEDQKQAEFYLTHLNYYRLVGYSLPFEVDHATHRFAPGTTFADVLNLYIFDRELRLLVLDARGQARACPPPRRRSTTTCTRPIGDHVRHPRCFQVATIRLPLELPEG